MKFIIALALFAVAANAHLVSRDIEIPAWRLNPKHTLKEWQAILANQEYKPEVVANYKPGTVRQPWNAGRVTVDPNIIGGSDAASGQFPWQVAVTLDGSSFCGGSIISTNWVMTAAHCARGISTFSMVFGSTARTGGTTGSITRTSTTAIVHESYNSITIVNDIAVVSISNDLPSNTLISAVRLPRRSQASNTFTGETATVSGWGKTADIGGVSADLKFVSMPVISNTECANTYGNIIRDTTICTSTIGPRSTCNGDSGGPLVWADTDGIYSEIGIVSFGSSEGCTKEIPVAFTRVTGYLSWIETNTGIAIRP